MPHSSATWFAMRGDLIASARTLVRLSRNDAKVLSRDSFLVGMFLYYFLLVTATRFMLPYLNERFAGSGGLTVSLSAWYPLIVAYLGIYVGGIMAGLLFGFLLLDEKDDATLQAMLVSPLPLSQYLAYRVAMPALAAFLMIFLGVLIIGAAVPGVLPLLLIAAGGALTSPITTLGMATLAQNKIQGMALTKVAGAGGLLIVAAWFVPEPLQLAFGLFPPYWTAKAYWLALDGSSWWSGALALGMLFQLGAIVALVRWFRAIAYR